MNGGRRKENEGTPLRTKEDAHEDLQRYTGSLMLNFFNTKKRFADDNKRGM